MKITALAKYNSRHNLVPDSAAIIMKHAFLVFAMFILTGTFIHAALVVQVSATKTVGSKTVIPLTMKNTFKEKVESARAAMFLFDEKGKMVGQATRWVIGGSKDRPALAPDHEITFNFVISADKPFTSTKVSFVKIILEGGKLADVTKDVTMATVEKK